MLICMYIKIQIFFCPYISFYFLGQNKCILLNWFFTIYAQCCAFCVRAFQTKCGEIGLLYICVCCFQLQYDNRKLSHCPLEATQGFWTL